VCGATTILILILLMDHQPPAKHEVGSSKEEAAGSAAPGSAQQQAQPPHTSIAGPLAPMLSFLLLCMWVAEVGVCTFWSPFVVSGNGSVEIAVY
jgi:hypothetical protein